MSANGPYAGLHYGLMETDPSQPAIAWQNGDVCKVRIPPDWEVTTTPKNKKLEDGVMNQVGALCLRQPGRGPVLFSFTENDNGDKGWTCMYRDENRRTQSFSQQNGDPPEYIAPYVQKAYEALNYLQKMGESANVNMEGLEEFDHFRTRADTVLESSSAGGDNMIVDLSFKSPANEYTDVNKKPSQTAMSEKIADLPLKEMSSNIYEDKNKLPDKSVGLAKTAHTLPPSAPHHPSGIQPT